MTVLLCALALATGTHPCGPARGGHAEPLPAHGGQAHVLIDPREIGREMAAQRGWTGHLFDCLDRLWTRESGWRPWAVNRSSGATGVPQALPGSKMASAGPDWRTSAWTQIRWGLGYVAGRYGDPCRALAHSDASGFY